MRTIAFAATLLALAGCEGCASSAQPTSESSSSTIETTTGGNSTAEPTEAPVDPGPPPTLGVRGEPTEDGVMITIENRGDVVVALSTSLLVERRGNGGWDAAEGVGPLALRDNCDAEPAECITLVPGAAFHPPAWSGKGGASQCACDECEPLGGGEYRLVVQSCNGAHRATSAAIELSD